MAANDQDVEELDRVTIRIAGDSGDASQVVGSQFTNTSAAFGNDVSTLPDFPAEIRAPAGSLPGVSSFQVSFSSYEIYTPGDAPDVLVAMNPAALKTNVADLPKGGTIIANTDEFTETNLRKAQYQENPLDDGSLEGYRVVKVPISSMNTRALKDSGLHLAPLPASTLDVPLALHIVRRSDGSGGIDNAQLIAAISNLNDAFIQSGLSFYIVGPTDEISSDFFYTGITSSAAIDTLRSTNRVQNAVNPIPEFLLFIEFLKRIPTRDKPIAIGLEIGVSSLSGESSSDDEHILC